MLIFRAAYGNGPAILPTLASAFSSDECCTASKNDLRPMPPEFCAGGAFGRSPSPRARTVLFPVARKRHNTAQLSLPSSRCCTFNIPSALTTACNLTEPHARTHAQRTSLLLGCPHSGKAPGASRISQWRCERTDSLSRVPRRNIHLDPHPACVVSPAA
jgi:hypothetical protein